MNIGSSTVKRWLAIVLLFSGGSSRGDSNTDLDALRATRIAHRLVALGFTPDARDGQLYRQTNMPLGVFLSTFGLKESDVHPVPGSSGFEWVRSTSVDGNRTILEYPSGSFTGQMTTNTIIQITVNIGYIRPAAICIGMNTSRAVDGLGFIGATRHGGGTVDGSTPPRFTLPDATGIEIESFVAPRDPREKPGTPVIAKITRGESGKGFADWERQNTQTITNVPIARFRTRGQ